VNLLHPLIYAFQWYARQIFNCQRSYITKQTESHLRTVRFIPQKLWGRLDARPWRPAHRNLKAVLIKIKWRKPRTVWNATAGAYLPLPFGCGSIKNSAPASTFSLRKEVIQPQVLLRLPCYDFTPIMNHTLGRCLPCGLAHRLLVQSTFVM
jgi:hypothetical protein